jgi:hypothetical protein
VADGSESWHLYDLAIDRFERTDVAAAHPNIVADMSARWQGWADRTGALHTGQPRIEKKPKPALAPASVPAHGKTQPAPGI